MHGRATPWDHAPVDLLCREAGGHAAMITGADHLTRLMTALLWQHLALSVGKNSPPRMDLKDDNIYFKSC